MRCCAFYHAAGYSGDANEKEEEDEVFDDDLLPAAAIGEHNERNTI